MEVAIIYLTFDRYGNPENHKHIVVIPDASGVENDQIPALIEEHTGHANVLPIEWRIHESAEA
jgi:hypothetical protein